MSMITELIKRLRKAADFRHTIGDYMTAGLHREAADTIEQLAAKVRAENSESQPCEDVISRQAAIFLADELKQDVPDDERMADMVMAHNEGILDYQSKLSLLPSVNPQYTENEIQKMQDLEQAEIEKAYELGKMEVQKSEDAISREDALMALTGEWTELTDELIHRFIKRIKALPPVNPQPKTGHWINGDCEGGNCSICREYYAFYPESGDFNYCPNCGARMVEPQESKETETWNGIHAQITAPKGTFERIFNEADEDTDI